MKFKMFHIIIAALLFCSSSCGGGETPAPVPDDPGKDNPGTEDPGGTDTPKKDTLMTFTASFADLDTPEFKSAWEDGDEIEVACFDGENLVTETIEASGISADGSTATFASKTIKKELDGYYAVIPGTGTDGYFRSYWSTASMDGTGVEKPSVTVASTKDSTFSFSNMYSLLSFRIDDEEASSVVLEGNGGENVDRCTFISFDGLEASAATSPTFSSSASLSKDIVPGQTYYFGLYPGLSLPSGYTLTAYKADGEVLGKAVSEEALAVEKGKVYAAPEFEIIRPIVKTPDFDPSKIVATFGVVSDVHVNGTQRHTDKWVSALKQISSKAAEQDPDGLDAVLVVGDLIDSPSSSQLGAFKSAYESVFDPAKMPMIYTIGNHDVPGYRWSSSMVSDASYIRSQLGSNYFLKDIDNEARTSMECRHCVVGDYHILCVSPNGTNPIVYSQSALNWLDSQLSELTASDPERYVIVLTHPMISNTVYGSRLGEPGWEEDWYSSLGRYWATDALTSILSKYPQVVDFGGHLHFPLNDPRSAWQGDFTVFGCASTRYMAIEPAGYEGVTSSTTVLQDSEEFSQGNVLQFDESGNLRLLRMDFYNGAVIGEPITLSYPVSTKDHLSKLNHTTLSIGNSAPSLSTMEVQVTDGNVSVTWAAGTDDEFVHHYELTLSRGSSEVAVKKVLADFYKHPQTSSMKDEWSLSFGQQDNGKYTLSIVAEDSWGLRSEPVTKDFTVGADGSVWAGDEAGSAEFDGGEGTAAESWLSYSSGKVSWTANSTGRPRTGIITMPNGAKYSVTQISVEDFKGTWSLYSKLFDPNRTLGKGNIAADCTKAEFGEPLNAETLKDEDGASHTNNLGIRGLYLNSVLDACVEIDYEGQNVRFGIFFDRRKAQSAGNGIYCAYLPEGQLTRTWTSGQYVFAPDDFSSTGYAWLWVDISSGMDRLSYVFSAAPEQIGKYYVCGISVAKATSEAKETIASGQDYDVIYQSNYNSVSSNGLYFQRN